VSINNKYHNYAYINTLRVGFCEKNFYTDFRFFKNFTMRDTDSEQKNTVANGLSETRTVSVRTEVLT